MKILNALMQIKISIGYGENHFTMKRGSFRYRTQMKWQRDLKQTGIERTPHGFVMSYEDPSDGRVLQLHVNEKDGRYEAVLSGNTDGINRYCLSLPCDQDEKFYGCGETYARFNLKGEKVRIFVAEHQNSNRIMHKLIRQKFCGIHPEHTLPFDKYESYYAQPTFVSSEKYYVHAETKQYAVFDFSHEDQICLFLQEVPHFYMEAADSFALLSEKMSSLLGRQKKLPDWIYDGIILAMQGGTEALKTRLQKAKDAGVKVNGIWSQDWCGCRKTGFGYQVMWNWQWDQQLYPDLDAKIREWKQEGIHFLGYINPFLAIEKDLYKYASAHGWCVKDQEGKDYLVKITTFPAAMIDFTNPDACAWYKSIIRKNMIDLGMSGWMADFGEYLPMDAVLHEGTPEDLHNQWPVIWAELNREAIEEAGKTDEVFFFTRAGSTGTIRSSDMMWTGDQHVDWSVDDGLPSVIPATLSLAMSGFGITHSDAGGYTTIMKMNRDKELLERWLEMNAFSPLLRTHEGNQPARNVQFDSDRELLQETARASRIHGALKPYLQAAVKACTEKGIPVMRPLFYAYDEPRAYLETSEYLLGDDLLVAPITENGAVSRQVYLPDDQWVDAYTGTEYGGGTMNVSAPIGRIPVFVRSQSKDKDLLCEIIQEQEGDHHA